jgi:hypothetical protein
MKRFLLALASVGLLGACDDIDGTLSVTKAFSLKTKKETISVSANTYRADFKYDENDRELEFEIKDLQNGEDVKSKFIVPAGRTIPRDNGEFMLTAQEMGQSFDLHGTLNTTSETDGPYRTSESCTYQLPERICYRECVPRRGCSTRCYTQYRTYYGYRDVEYDVTTTHRKVTAEFLTAGTNESLANFAGERTDSYRRYTYTGNCR